MHATVYLLHAGQLKSAGDAAKSGEFIGELSWVEFNPVGVRGFIVTFKLCFYISAYFPDDASDCANFLRHKSTLISPTVLHHNNVPYDKVL